MARRTRYATVLIPISCVIEVTVSSAWEEILAICESIGPPTSIGTLVTGVAAVVEV